MDSAVLTAIIDGSPDLMSFVDRDYTYRYVNRAYLKQHCITTVDIVGKTPADIMGQEKFEALIKPNLDRCFAGESVSYQGWFEFKSGLRAFCDVVYSPVSDESHKVVGAAVSVRDITVQKDAEDRALEANAKLHGLVQSIGEGLVEIDDKASITFANTEALCILGVPETENILGQPVDDYLDVGIATKDETGEPLEIPLLDAPTRHSVPSIFKNWQGRRVPVEFSCAPTTYAPGRMGRTFVFRDISRRLNAEARVKSLLAEKDMILESAHEGITFLRAGNFISVNQRFCEMFGWDRDEVLGRNPRFLFTTPGDYDEFVAQTLSSVEAELGMKQTLELKQQSGKQIWVRVTAKATAESNADETGHVLIFDDVTNEKRLLEELEHRAFTDSLTGLPNRALFEDRLGQAIELAKRKDTKFALLFLDLDGFKAINDSEGHQVGDRVLVEIAERIRDHLRAVDTVARLGGDEFLILLSGTEGDDSIKMVASKIAASLTQPLMAARDSKVSVSIGCARFPIDGDSPGVLIRRADAAMYLVKGRGKNGFAFYEKP